METAVAKNIETYPTMKKYKLFYCITDKRFVIGKPADIDIERRWNKKKYVRMEYINPHLMYNEIKGDRGRSAFYWRNQNNTWDIYLYYHAGPHIGSSVTEKGAGPDSIDFKATNKTQLKEILNDWINGV